MSATWVVTPGLDPYTAYPGLPSWAKLDRPFRDSIPVGPKFASLRGDFLGSIPGVGTQFMGPRFAQRSLICETGWAQLRRLSTIELRSKQCFFTRIPAEDDRNRSRSGRATDGVFRQEHPH